MKHIIPTDLINKVLTYLAGKAYSEVALLIQEIKAQAVLHVEQPSAPAAIPPDAEQKPE